MVSSKKINSTISISNSGAPTAPRMIRPHRIATPLENGKIRDPPKKLSDSSIYKLENAAKSDNNFNNTISSLPAKGEKVPYSTATTKPGQEGTAAGSPKPKADKTEKMDINNVPPEPADQPTSTQAKRQRSPSASVQSTQDKVSHAGPTQPRDAITIWKSVRGQTATETRNLRKQQKERMEKMEAQKKAEQQAAEEAMVQKEKMKFMIPSSDEAMTNSDTDEDNESEVYVRGVNERINAMASVYQSVERDSLIIYKDRNQVMGGVIAKEAPLRPFTGTSPRKQSPEARVEKDVMDMDMGNEDDESPPHISKRQRPKMSSEMDIGDDDEEGEDKKPPTHLCKLEHRRPNKRHKATTDIQLDEDDEESPHKPTSERLRRRSARVKPAVVEVEDDEDELADSSPRNRRVSSGRPPKEVNSKARVVEDANMDDVIQKSPVRARALRRRPSKAAKTNARVIESEHEDEDEEMEDVDKSPPRTRVDYRIAAAKRPKAKIGGAPRIDPYDETALYTSFSGFNLNAPNKTLDKARMGEGMGPYKHK